MWKKFFCRSFQFTNLCFLIFLILVSYSQGNVSSCQRGDTLTLEPIISSATQEKFSVDGEHVVIACCTSKNVRKSPKWYDPNGNEIGSFFDQPRRDVYVMSDYFETQVSRVYLVINQFNASYKGAYQCIGGDSQESSAIVKLEEAHRVKVTAPESVMLEIGKSGQVPCRVQGPPNTFHVNWFFKGDHITEHNGNYRLLEGSQVLEIKSVNGQLSAGQYLCKVEQENPHFIDIRPIRVYVYSPPVLSKESPLVGGTRTEGNEMTLTCSASGYPRPRIAWQKNQQEIIGDGVKVNIQTIYEGREATSSLTVNDLELYDYGEYGCLAEFIDEKHHINATDYRRIVPNLVFKPRILPDTHLSSKVRVGDSVTLRCSVIGAQASNLSVNLWKNDRLLRQSDVSDRFKLSMEHKELVKAVTLEISEVKPVDSGNYICRSKTDVGNLTEEGYLNVLFAPIVSAPSSHILGISHEQSVLTCVANASPQVAWRWRLDHSPVDIYGSLYTMEVTTDGSISTSRLVVLPHQNSRPVYGVYSCEATNSEGSSSANVRLERAFRPQPPQAEICELKPRSIQFCLTLPENGNGLPLTHMEIRYREAEDGRMFGYALPLKNEVVIPSLIPGRHYLFAISVVSPAGRSQSVILKTKTPLPQKPVISVQPSLMDVKVKGTSSTIPLSWTVEQKGDYEIQDYVVRYRPVLRNSDDDDTNDQEGKFGPWRQVVLHGEGQQQINLGHVMPETKYEICITPRTKMAVLAPNCKTITSSKLDSRASSKIWHSPIFNLFLAISNSYGIWWLATFL